RAQRLDQLAGRWLDGDDAHVRPLLLQVAADPHERAARAEPRDEHVQLGTVTPDLRTRALVVRERVRRVAVLEQELERGIVGRELLGQTDRAIAPFGAG